MHDKPITGDDAVMLFLAHDMGGGEEANNSRQRMQSMQRCGQCDAVTGWRARRGDGHGSLIGLPAADCRPIQLQPS